MANKNTANAANKANEQIINTTENKKSMPIRNGGRCFRNTSDGYKIAIAPKNGINPTKNPTSDGKCNHDDNQPIQTTCQTKQSKNAKNTLGLCAGNVRVESIAFAAA